VVTVTARPDVARVHRTRVSVTVTVSSPGNPVTGWVRVRADGRTYTARVSADGTATVTLKAFRSTGRQLVVAAYGGDARNQPAVGSAWVRVVR
jgi:hypothetical protein